MSRLHHDISRLSGFSRLSVGYKLVGLTMLFVAVISIMVLYVSVTLGQQKNDATVINIAGRERMLTQKFTKEFFLALDLAKTNKTTIKLDQLDKTKRLFEVSLKALKNGGETFLDLGMTKAIQIPGTKNPQIRQQIEKVDSLWGELHKAVSDDISKLNSNESLSEINKMSVAVLANMNKAVGMFAAEADNKVQTMLSNQKWIWGTAIFISVFIAWLIVRAITIPLQHIVATTQRIADGDLKKYSLGELSDDELGILTRQVEDMRFSLTDVISSVQQNSQQMTYSSEQIATISNEISQSNQQQQESVTQVIVAKDSLQQIATTVSEHIEQANSMAEETRRYASEGVDTVNMSIAELVSAVDSVNSTAGEMSDLHQATQQINEIIDTISNIADQTNLLALNAAIEAARAGEHGRGFAVVADEVRNLARRTADSTTEITQLINQLTSLVEKASSSMQEVVSKVHVSRKKSEETVAAFDSMTDGINRTTNSTEQIAQYNEQQLVQLDEVGTRLNELVAVLSVSSEKASSTSMVAGDLNLITEHLNVLLNKFETDGIELPSKLDEEKRAYPRINNRIKVDLTQDGVTAHGQTKDISMSGLHIQCPNHFIRGKDIDVELYLPEDLGRRSSLTLNAQIMRQEEGDNMYLYGVKLQSLSDEQKAGMKQIFRFFGKPCKFS